MCNIEQVKFDRFKIEREEEKFEEWAYGMLLFIICALILMGFLGITGVGIVVLCFSAWMVIKTIKILFFGD